MTHLTTQSHFEMQCESLVCLRVVGEFQILIHSSRCAIGASFETRYHPDFVTFPKSLVDFFGDRAKALLEVEMDSPCVATVQSLVICSSLEVGSGREARGWLYSGTYS